MTANVLVVDDIAQNIQLLEAKLLREYYNVFTASNGADALNSLEQNNIDIVLLDCMMPGMDGFETCLRIKSNPQTSHIPVVLVTALSDKENRLRGLEAGADEFLTKPIDDMALFARLKSLTRTKSVIDELKLRSKTNHDFGIKAVVLDHDFSESKILIIDDDIVQASNLLIMLSTITHHVEIASTVEKVHDIINSGFAPDTIIVSCQLEDQDPLRILASIRSINSVKHISVVMMTEEYTIPMVLKALDMGANDYFMAHIDKSELVARVKTQLRRKYYQDDLRNDLTRSINLSVKDELSNLYNRRYFEKYIVRTIQKANSELKSLYIMMIDIDHFKNINDQYGHNIGDKVIIEASNVIKTSVRAEDFITRYGGEEFIVVVFDVAEIEVRMIAERIRANMENCDLIVSNAQPVKVTLSIGVTEYEPEDSIASLVIRSDKALYEAKDGGRNKVVFKK
ncbi:MAG: PleD family two-component system response regulator [Pseudomonadota bacterium]|jgi:two-component system cell cycle response regulator